MRKHKNGNVYANKRKSECVYTKTNKITRHNVKNNNSEKLKHLRRNVHSTTQVVPLPHATAIGANKKKHFAMKFKGGFLNHECIVKFLKLIHKLDKLIHKIDKNPKFTKSKKTMEILHGKSNMRLTILLVKDVITLNPNTMKSNATTR